MLTACVRCQRSRFLYISVFCRGMHRPRGSKIRDLNQIDLFTIFISSGKAPASLVRIVVALGAIW